MPLSKTGSAIPRIIHQTCGCKELPPLIHKGIAALKARNPGWEYRYYDDQAVEDYIRLHFPHYMPVFQRINPKYGSAKADLFRYLLMYREGGVYLDIKSTFTQPLDEVLHSSDRYLLSHWTNEIGTRYALWGTYDEIANPRGEFQQCFIVCAPGHAFLAAVIERVIGNLTHYDRARDGVGRRLVHVTGPVAYTLAITPLLASHVHRLADSHSELSFVYNFYKDGIINGHTELFDYHYRSLDEPIVLNGTDGPMSPAG
ncbi:MAG: glycosyltransferase [Xanthomonadales bacterium]|nr:glycosyltransferase [Xanthomonadales bacterium]